MSAGMVVLAVAGPASVDVVVSEIPTPLESGITTAGWPSAVSLGCADLGDTRDSGWTRAKCRGAGRGSRCSGWRGTDATSVLLSPNPEGTEVSPAGNDVDVSATLGMSPVDPPYSGIGWSAALNKRYSPRAGQSHATVIITRRKISGRFVALATWRFRE
jgi:hypothetical protein